MHSSHHVESVERKRELCHLPRAKIALLKRKVVLPPARITDPTSIHLPHISHSNDANRFFSHIEQATPQRLWEQ